MSVDPFEHQADSVAYVLGNHRGYSTATAGEQFDFEMSSQGQARRRQPYTEAVGIYTVHGCERNERAALKQSHLCPAGFDFGWRMGAHSVSRSYMSINRSSNQLTGLTKTCNSEPRQ